MRLSESIRKNIFSHSSGVILNSFKAKNRRDVIFFEDILAEFIRDCEAQGYGPVVLAAAQEWMMLAETLVPSLIRKLPPYIIFNNFLKKAWTNIGLMDGLKFAMYGKTVRLMTENEAVSRLIGKNMFMAGIYSGILKVLYDSEIELAGFNKDGPLHTYRFRISNAPPAPRRGCRAKEAYNKLNYPGRASTSTLRNALNKRTMVLRGNRLYFRDRSLIVLENTIFHLLGAYGLPMGKIPAISQKYFSGIIDAAQDEDKKLVLLKMLLQSTGWGNTRIIKASGKVIIHITNPPYGLQAEGDSWTFLAMVILGYLRPAGRYCLKGVRQKSRTLIIEYSKNRPKMRPMQTTQPGK
ncbi:MAG: hypothetical protein HY367_03685 [Candidatus Aenigmarchaeota archaeon]|nr:hypothetical protein [Candidatus Aenigmarchaeota archaeon]